MVASCLECHVVESTDGVTLGLLVVATTAAVGADGRVGVLDGHRLVVSTERIERRAHESS